MKDRALEKERSEKRKRVLALGRGEVPATEIAKAVKVPRTTVVKWLEAAGIEPVMLRKRPQDRAGASVRNTPLALSIERGVKERLEKQAEEEARAQKKEA